MLKCASSSAIWTRSPRIFLAARRCSSGSVSGEKCVSTSRSTPARFASWAAWPAVMWPADSARAISVSAKVASQSNRLAPRARASNASVGEESAEYTSARPLHSTRTAKQSSGCRVLAFRPITEASTVAVGALALSFVRTRHPLDCLAVRVECNGRALVYSADSSPTHALEALARGANLLLCEATFADTELALAESAGHMTAGQAAELAKRAGVERLVLTHFSPDTDPEEQRRAAAKILGDRVQIAEEDAHFSI